MAGARDLSVDYVFTVCRALVFLANPGAFGRLVSRYFGMVK